MRENAKQLLPRQAWLMMVDLAKRRETPFWIFRLATTD
jgi:hypothetical protein